jgi:hypothetical protein
MPVGSCDAVDVGGDALRTISANLRASTSSIAAYRQHPVARGEQPWDTEGINFVSPVVVQFEIR